MKPFRKRPHCSNASTFDGKRSNAIDADGLLGQLSRAQILISFRTSSEYEGYRPGGGSTASLAAARFFGRDSFPSNVFMTRSSARISVKPRVVMVLYGCVLWDSDRRTSIVSTTLMPIKVVKSRNQPSTVSHFFSRASSDWGDHEEHHQEHPWEKEHGHL